MYQKTEILEVKNRGKNLRFHHIPEVCGKTDLEKDFRMILQKHFKIKGSFPGIDQICRINSRIVSENNLPWDILVKCTYIKTRDLLWNKLRNSPLIAYETEIQIFQDLLPTTLKTDFTKEIDSIPLENSFSFSNSVSKRRKTWYVWLNEQVSLLMKMLWRIPFWKIGTWIN